MTHAGRARLVERVSHNDTEAAAALVILDALNDNRAWRHVTEDGIHWSAILDNGTWSSGERKLLELGRALWKGDGYVDVVYVFAGLSGRFEQAVVDAVTARRGGVALPCPTGFVMA